VIEREDSGLSGRSVELQLSNEVPMAVSIVRCSDYRSGNSRW